MRFKAFTFSKFLCFTLLMLSPDWVFSQQPALPDYTVADIEGNLKKGFNNEIDVSIKNVGKSASAVLQIELTLIQSGQTQKYTKSCKLSKSKSAREIKFTNINLATASELKATARIKLSRGVTDASLANNVRREVLRPAPLIQEGQTPTPRKRNSN